MEKIKIPNLRDNDSGNKNYRNIFISIIFFVIIVYSYDKCGSTDEHNTTVKNYISKIDSLEKALIEKEIKLKSVEDSNETQKIHIEQLLRRVDALKNDLGNINSPEEYEEKMREITAKIGEIDKLYEKIVIPISPKVKDRIASTNTKVIELNASLVKNHQKISNLEDSVNLYKNKLYEVQVEQYRQPLNESSLAEQIIVLERKQDVFTQEKEQIVKSLSDRDGVIAAKQRELEKAKKEIDSLRLTQRITSEEEERYKELEGNFLSLRTEVGEYEAFFKKAESALTDIDLKSKDGVLTVVYTGGGKSLVSFGRYKSLVVNLVRINKSANDAVAIIYYGNKEIFRGQTKVIKDSEYKAIKVVKITDELEFNGQGLRLKKGIHKLVIKTNKNIILNEVFKVK